MSLTSLLVATAALLVFGLTPVLNRYQGRLSGKLSCLGLRAEITVDGRGCRDDENPNAQLLEQKLLDKDAE